MGGKSDPWLAAKKGDFLMRLGIIRTSKLQDSFA